MEGWLTERAAAQREWRFGTRRLILYAHTPERAKNLLAPAKNWTPPPPEQPLAANETRIIGWEQPLVRVKAGDLAHVAVTIQRNGLPEDAPLTLMLGEQPLAQIEATIPAGSGLMRLPLTLTIPPNAPAGRYPYIARIDDARAIMGWVQLFGGNGNRDRTETVHPQHPLKASFGDPPLARLLGYDIAGELTPGGALRLTLYWQAQNPTDISYKVFVHLIGADGRPAAQGDDFPVNGKHPTIAWQPNELITDFYTIHLPANTPPGLYPLRIGFYDPASGERLSPVLNAEGIPQPEDQLQLDIIHIE